MVLLYIVCMTWEFVVAYPQSGSLSIFFKIDLELRNVCCYLFIYLFIFILPHTNNITKN